MTIHTVKQGDTIGSIAATYNVPSTRLEIDNNLSPNQSLNIGRAIMITYPKQTYIVQSGDTLGSIAEFFGVTIKQLLRNNPSLSERDTFSLNPGEELILSYDNKAKQIKVNGFANSFINIDILKRTLPFLTYITIINYRVAADGSIIDINDTQIIQMSKAYGVAPIMFISSLDEHGIGNYAVTHNIFNNLELQNKLIDYSLSLLKSKGFYGLFLGFQKILPEDLQQYVNFVTNITKRLNLEGYEVFVSLIPDTFGHKPGIPDENNSLSVNGQIANYVTLITYQWTTAFISQYAETTVSFIKEYLDFVITQIPPEKIFIGLERIAYDWELPYVEGETLGRLITNSGAIDLASQLNAEIQFDVETQTPYFYYNSLAGVQNFVWFKDARTVDAILNLVIEYNLSGIAVWNIMYYYIVTWVVINTQYDIESVLTDSLNEIIE